MMWSQVKMVVYDRNFTKQALRIMLPSALQSLLFLLVNLIDVFTINMALGSQYQLEINQAIEAVSIVSTIFGLNFVLINAVCVAGNVYGGQYLGDKKYGLLQETTRYKILVSFIIAVIFSVLLINFKSQILNLFVHEPAGGGSQIQNEIIRFGSSYLDFGFLSFILISISVPIAYTMTASGQPLVPLCASGVAIIVNIILTLFFGMSFSNFASMGMEGHGLSTVISRIVELMILVGYLIIKNPIYTPGWRIWRISGRVWSQISKTLIFVLLSELFYQFYLILQLLILVWMVTNKFGYTDLDAQVGSSALNLTATVVELVYAFLCGCAITLPYLVGSELGLKNYTKAKENADKLIVIMYLVLFILMLFMMIIGLIAMEFIVDGKGWQYQITTLLSIIGAALGFFVYGISFFKINVLRNGGRQLIASLADTLPYYCCYLLLEVLMFLGHVPVAWVLFTIPLTQVVQYAVSFILYRKIEWARSVIKTGHQLSFTKVDSIGDNSQSNSY